MSNEEVADWVFESVLQYLRSPLWTSPVHGFIDEHCGTFDPKESENKLEYTQLHKQFQEMVEGLLGGFLEELGVPPELFIEAAKSGRSPELSAMVMEYIYALDDFPSFRSMMERHNHAMDLEAMCEYAKLTDAAGRIDDPEMDEEERFLVEMAIKASLTNDDISAQQQQVQDAELLQALALSVAQEHERVVRAQMAADEAAQDAAKAEEAQKAAAEAKKMQGEEAAKVKALNDKILEERKKNASAKPTAPAKPALAPVSNVGDGKNAAFGAARFKPLPSLPVEPLAPVGVSPPRPAAPVAPATAEVEQPKFSELAKPVSAPSKEEEEQRAAYLKAQREQLIKAKAEARAKELSDYKTQKGDAPASPAPAQPARGSTDAAKLSEKEREMRAAIARRFRA